MLQNVSVLLPFHRADSYLRDAIASIKGSKNTSVQLILIDDRPLKISDEFSRISSIWTGGMGYAEALNAGKRFATEEFVALMNSDDLISKNRLSMQVNLLRNSESTVSVTRLRKFNRPYRPIFSIGGNPRILKPSPGYFLVGSHLANASWMTHNAFWQKNCHFMNISVGADWVLGSSLIQEYSFHYINSPHYFYRSHSNQITKSMLENSDQLSLVWENLNIKSGGLPLPKSFGLALVFPSHINWKELEITPETLSQFEAWVKNFYQNSGPDLQSIAEPRIAYLSFLLWRRHRNLQKVTPYIAQLSKMFVKSLLNGDSRITKPQC